MWPVQEGTKNKEQCFDEAIISRCVWCVLFYLFFCKLFFNRDVDSEKKNIMKVFNFSSVIEILTDIEKKILLFCNISLINKNKNKIIIY